MANKEIFGFCCLVVMWLLKGCASLFLFVTLTAIIIGYFVIPDVGRGRNAKIFERYPVDSVFKLSNGRDIKMPWHVYKAQHAMLVGEATNKKLVENVLDDLGFYPLLSSKGLPLVSFGVVEYMDGAAGAYNEIYVSFLASKSPPLEDTFMQYLAFIVEVNPFFAPIRGLLGLDGLTLVVWKMYVNTELSLLGGREIWGYPKEMADIKIEHSHYDRKEITKCSTKLDGQDFVKLGQSGVWPFFAQKLPFFLDGTSATPKTYFHSIGDSKGQVVCKFKPFNSKTDEFEINPNSDAGKEISALHFSPWLWFDLSFFEVVLFRPHYTE